MPLVFPATTPTIGAVTTLHTAYHSAVLAWRRGDKASTSLRKSTRRDLHIALTDLAYDCANQASGDEAQFLLTGFDIRVHGGISPVLPAPNNFVLKAGDEGQLIARFTKIENNHGYEVWLSSGPFVDPTVPSKKYPASKTTLIIPDLVSGQRYFGRARAVGARNIPGAWSDISGKICP